MWAFLLIGAKWTDGKFGKALSFDGKDDFVEIPDDKSLQLPMGLTVAGWIYIRKYKHHAAWCWKGERIGWGPNLLNKWFHATQTCDGKVMEVYINGEIADIVDQPAHAEVSGPYLVFEGQPVEIAVGRSTEDPVMEACYWDGLIDEVAIWNRALSEDEINQLMKGLPLEVLPAGKLSTTWAQIKSY